MRGGRPAAGWRAAAHTELHDTALLGSSRPRYALVRGVPESFSRALVMAAGAAAPPDVARARAQHAAYVAALQGLVQQVVELPADEAYPDCPFVEDTAIVLDGRALITRPGAVARQGEENAVRAALQSLGLQLAEVRPGARIDGGDVMPAAGKLFVGRSKATMQQAYPSATCLLGGFENRRTDEEGIASLEAAFPGYPVVPIDVLAGLHLKSLMSYIGNYTIAVDSSPSVLRMFEAVQRAAPELRRIVIPQACAANACSAGIGLIYSAPAGSAAVSVYSEAAGQQAIRVDLSEFHLVDGGPSCLSLIVH
eukprot:SM000126S26342  [mRNA]  locus=s126:227284:228870:- [translate_table: standard]